MSDYKFVGSFVDTNIPSHQATGSKEEVKQAAHDFCAQFGPAVKSVWIVEPDGTKHVYNGQGTHLFAVPSLTKERASV